MTDVRTVLVHARSPMNAVMVRPVVRALQRDARLRFMFHCGKPSTDSDRATDIFAPLGGAGGLPPGPVTGVLRTRWSRFDLLLSPDIRMPSPRAARRVQMFHGVSFKGKAYTDKVRRDYTDVFVIGDYMRRRFVELGIFAEGDSALCRVGMPKTDALVDGSVSRTRVLGTLGLDPERTTVIYAPTWRKESSLNVEGEAILDALEAMGLNVLVKIHDHSRDPRSNRRDWGAWLDARENAHVRRVRDADIVPYLVSSDLLVSDASSVANEFALLDRPILFMDVPALLDVYSDSADLDTWGRKTGDVVAGASALQSAVEKALSDPAARSDVRCAAARDLFYNPGGATSSAVREIYRLLDLDLPGSV